MSASGTLSEGLIPSLLREIYVGRRTGLLSFRRDAERHGVRFLRGSIVHADTNVAPHNLGETMVRHGLLRPEDLDVATVVMLRTGRRLGQALRETGIVGKDALEDAVALHVREILLQVFAWTDGEWSFHDEPPEGFSSYDITLRVSTGELILAAVRSVRDPDVVRYALGDLDRVLVPASDPLLRFQRVKLTPADGFILSRADGVLSAREVLKIAPVPVEQADRSLFSLLCVGMLEYVPRAAEPANPTPLQLRRRVLDLHENLATRDHFEVLGLARSAGEAEVAAAYLRLARLLHPDAQHDPALADLGGRLEAVFARVVEAHRVLSSRRARAEYEAGLLLARLAPEPAPEPQRATAPPVVDLADAHERTARDLARAEEAFAAERYFDTLQILEDVLQSARGRLRRRARVLRASTYLKNPRWARAAVGELEAALDEDARNPEACVLLAGLYRDSGSRRRAAELARRALELCPRHAEAAAMLSELGDEKARTGLLGRILG